MGSEVVDEEAEAGGGGGGAAAAAAGEGDDDIEVVEAAAAGRAASPIGCSCSCNWGACCGALVGLGLGCCARVGRCALDFLLKAPLSRLFIEIIREEKERAAPRRGESRWIK